MPGKGGCNKKPQTGEPTQRLNPLTPMSNQERTYPYNVNAISSRQVMEIRKNVTGGLLVDPTHIIPVVKLKVRRVSNKILRVKG